MIIGITGGTGCGKTTLLSCVRERGGLVLDCDEIYHQLLQTDQQMMTAIADRFPGTVEQGRLNRKRLGGIVFSDRDALADLNRITHGAVKRQVQRCLAEHKGLAAIDAIALFEGGLAELCDVTVAVSAPQEARVSRLMARDGISREYALARIRAQKGEAFFWERCGYVLDNDGSEEQVREKCQVLLSEILD